MAEEGEDGPALFAAPAAGGHEALPPDPAPQTDGAGSSAAGGSEADASVADNSAAPDEPRSAATAAATASPPAAPVASTASPEQQWAQLLQQLPVADSAPQVVKYLGRHQQSFTRQQLPNGDYCCSVIRRLRDCRRRRRFRHGVCKWLRLQVTCRRALMQATPIVAAELPGGPLQRPLLRMVCVADLDQYICCVTGASQANGLVACEADVFEVRENKVHKVRMSVHVKKGEKKKHRTLPGCQGRLAEAAAVCSSAVRGRRRRRVQEFFVGVRWSWRETGDDDDELWKKSREAYESPLPP